MWNRYWSSYKSGWLEDHLIVGFSNFFACDLQIYLSKYHDPQNILRPSRSQVLIKCWCFFNINDYNIVIFNWGVKMILKIIFWGVLGHKNFTYFKNVRPLLAMWQNLNLLFAENRWLTILPEQKCPGTHSSSLSDEVNDESGHGHHCTLGHTPSRLHHNEVFVGNVRRAMGSHIWRHVCHHVAKGVERPHGELEEEAPEDSQEAVEGDVPEDDVVDGRDFRHLWAKCFWNELTKLSTLCTFRQMCCCCCLPTKQLSKNWRRIVSKCSFFRKEFLIELLLSSDGVRQLNWMKVKSRVSKPLFIQGFPFMGSSKKNLKMNFMRVLQYH